MVLGQYEGIVGSGNRVSFPKKFRQELTGSLIVTKGLDKNIIIVGKHQEELLTAGIAIQPFTDQRTRELQAFILGNACEVELDRLGRFVIPEYLRIHAGITKEVIFSGIESFVQLWDRQRFVEHQKALQTTISENAEKLPGKE